MSKLIISFTRQLSTLVKAGIPLLRALQIIAPQVQDRRFRNAVEQVLIDVEEGKSLSEALSLHRRYFSNFYINMIKAAEVSGNLAAVLKELSDYLVQNRKLLNSVRSAMMYPIFVLFMSVSILAIIMVFVIPTLTKIFADLGGDLPPATKLLIGMSNFIVEWGYLFLLGLVLFGFFIFFMSRKPALSRILNAWKWKFPVLGDILKMVTIGRFCRTLGTLLSSGVTILKGLEVLRETTISPLVEDALAYIYEKVEGGTNLSDAMEETGVFPLTVVKMVGIGEESGKVSGLLLEIAEDYEDEVSTALTGFISLLEPLLIVVMGVIIGFIVISLFFPIFTMGELVK
ncbi:MAG: type II secretion system F family protein [Candidatus Omnitrophica bacterium]|nr:type II secretion system F family protein [Candidatus Omnitrophota bacterium]